MSLLFIKGNKNQIRILALIIFVISIAGCASKSVIMAEQSQSEFGPVISTPQSPFSLQVTSVQNDGRNLKVEGLIITKASWYVDKVSVVLTAFNHGEPVVSQSRPLKDFLNQDQLAPATASSPFGSSELGVALPAETPLAFSMSVPSENISDYQVSLGWGENAVLNVANSIKWIENGIVDLGPISDCDGTSCPHLYAVEGILKNESSATVTAVTATLRLIPIGSGSVEEGQAEDVELKPLSLLSKASQRVRLKFKSPINPELIGGLKADVQIKASK